MKKHIGISVVLTLLFALPGFGDVIHDESLDGELSNVFTNPTQLTLGLGSNEIIGQMGNNGQTGAIGTGGDPVDRDADYFSFVVGAGQMITGIDVQAYSAVGDPSGPSFGAYVAGASFAGQGLVDVDGFVLFNDTTNPNLLQNLVGGPLGPGTYSFWLQETADAVIDYEINVNVVPEPSSISICALAMSAILFRRRRTKA